MSYGYHCYEQGKDIDNNCYEFYPLIQAAMRRADDDNLAKLKAAWPELYKELKERYDAPGGKLGEETTPKPNKEFN